MPTPSSGSPISFSQIMSEFAANPFRYHVQPSIFGYSTGNSYWIRAEPEPAGRVRLPRFSIQVVWEGVVVFSQTTIGEYPPSWNMTQFTGDSGIIYFRGPGAGNSFSVQRQVLKNVRDQMPYSLSDYGVVYGSSGDNVNFVPDSSFYGPAAFKNGILTNIPSRGSSISFSNFQGFSARTMVGDNLGPTYQQVIAEMPPGRYFVALRAIGGGGGGGPQDSRRGGDGGAGVYIQGTLILQSSESIRILASVGGGGAGGPYGNGSSYGNTAGGTVGGSSSQANPVGGAGGRAGYSGTSGFGGGGGGATEVWVQYGSTAPFLLCVAGGGGGGGGGGNRDWPLGYDSNAKHGNRDIGGLILGNTSNRLLYGGRGQDAAESTWTSIYYDPESNTSSFAGYVSVADGGGSGGAGGGQTAAGIGGGAYAVGQGWYEQTGLGGNSGWAFRNNQSFTWLSSSQTFSYRTWRPMAGSAFGGAWGAGGLAGQSNGSWGSNGVRGNVEVSYSNIGINEIAALRSFVNNSTNFW